MKKDLVIGSLLLLLMVLGCRENTYQIDGTVDNRQFENATVYLVALDAPITRHVDSTTIKNGKFYFEGKADSMEVRILRIHPRYPDYAEDLLVVLETGTIQAELAFKSSGKGTRLNDQLQHWKETKMMYDSIRMSIYREKKYEGTTEARRDSLTKLSNEISEAFLENNICTMKENVHNGIGLLMFKLFYASIPAKDKNEVLQQVGNLYFERDKELNKRVQR